MKEIFMNSLYELCSSAILYDLDHPEIWEKLLQIFKNQEDFHHL